MQVAEQRPNLAWSGTNAVLRVPGGVGEWRSGGTNKLILKEAAVLAMTLLL